MSAIQDVLDGRARWCVVEGHNREVLPTLPDKSVAHVITDPPYETESHVKGRRIMNPRTKEVRQAALSFAQIDEPTREFIGTEAGRLVLRWCLVFAQLEGAMRWREAIEPGLRYVRTLVWTKPNAQPQLTGDRPGVGYECIVVSHGFGRSHWNGGGRRGVFEHCVDANFSREIREHETQKPLPLMLELVELFTDEGDVVLDPFCGSGTTGVACLRLGRRFIGIEREPKWATLSKERLEAETRGLSLRDARSGQTSIFDALGAP